MLLLSTGVFLIGTQLLADSHGASIPNLDVRVPQPPVCDETLFCFDSGTDSISKDRLYSAIDQQCDEWDGHQLSGEPETDGIEAFFGAQRDWYGPSMTMVIQKTGKYNSMCGYKIMKQSCQRWFRLPVDNCSWQQGGNVTDDWCGLQYLIYPDGPAVNDHSKGKVIPWNCSTNTEPGFISKPIISSGLSTSMNCTTSVITTVALPTRSNIPLWKNSTSVSIQHPAIVASAARATDTLFS